MLKEFRFPRKIGGFNINNKTNMWSELPGEGVIAHSM